ncbi:MAG TPA: hypothetical protein VF092_23075 [Longimicrobium sp.]
MPRWNFKKSAFADWEWRGITIEAGDDAAARREPILPRPSNLAGERLAHAHLDRIYRPFIVHIRAIRRSHGVVHHPVHGRRGS